MNAESYECECLECGHKMTSENHCNEIVCSECGGEMRRAERPGVGYVDFSDEMEFMAKPFGHPAGQTLQGKRIISLIPKHNKFVEPFCGSATIFFMKDPTDGKEILNDLSANYTKALRLLKNINDDQIKKIIKKNWTGSASYFSKIKNMTPPQDDIDWLHWFLYKTTLSFGSMGGSFDSSDEGHTRTLNQARRYEKIRDRMKNATITKKDWVECVREHDTKDTFFYIDPPYYSAKDKRASSFKIGEVDLKDFVKVLKSIKGKFICSIGDESNWIKEMKDAGFRVKKITSQRSIPTLETGNKKSTADWPLVTNFDIKPLNIYSMAEFSIEDAELTAVAPHDTLKADIETPWDATEAELNIRKWASSDGSGDKDKIDWAKYRQGFAWYNNDDLENIGSYKLPHHDIIDNSLKVVWKGVAAGMGALMGARTPIKIPDEDKKPVYTHLSGHYEQFEKDVPELSRCDDFFSAITPKFEKLSLADSERTGQTEILMIDGTAIAEGYWKNTMFTADIVKDALERAGGLRIDVEHEDESWEDVKGFNYKPRWNDVVNGIDVSGAIFDEKVIDWYKRNPDTKIGLSVKLNDKATFEQIDGKKTCTFLDFKGITLTLNPACKVCWLKSAELVELSSSDKTDGGTEMAEKQKTPEELAAEKKLADDKKLADEKKIADEKLEADKKLADEKAETDEEQKKQEEAATAKAEAAKPTALNAEIEKRFSEMQTEIDTLKTANTTLSNERSLSETNAMVNGLIESGQISEAKREGTTKVLMALSSDEDRAAFLNTVGGQKAWEAGEKGLVLSEDKDKDKDKELEFSEPERRSFT